MQRRFRYLSISAVIVVVAVALLFVGTVLADDFGNADFSADTIKFNYKENATTFWGSDEKPVSVQVDAYTITAPYLEYYQGTGKVMASGGVNLEGKEPQLTLVCDQIEAGDSGILASGKVQFDFGDVSATADKLNYVPEKDWVRLEGNPVVRTASGKITGAVIEIDLSSGIVTASGGSRLELDGAGQ